jgi:hypothetical protein
MIFLKKKKISYWRRELKILHRGNKSFSFSWISVGVHCPFYKYWKCVQFFFCRTYTYSMLNVDFFQREGEKAIDLSTEPLFVNV